MAVGAVLAPFRFHGGRTTATMHREYPRLYHETYLGALPKGQGFLITRAGSLGEQDVNTCIWPGDLDSNFTTHADGRVGGLPAAITVRMPSLSRFSMIARTAIFTISFESREPLFPESSISSDGDPRSVVGLI